MSGTNTPLAATQRQELHRLTATQLVASLQAGTISCAQACAAAVTRIEALDRPLNAVVVRCFASAVEAARALDGLSAAERLRMPLYGLPMTVKESFDVAGLASCWGLPDQRGNFARTDAEVVRRLRAAGAIILGKTNVAPALADWQSANPVYGRTNNPWDTSRTPGGSSGGAAAALAAGFTALEVGSDIGGSIRGPAHFCGVWGHKPSWGVVPLDGHSLPGDLLPPDIGVAGPLARCAQDLQLAMEVIAGPCEPDAQAWRLALPVPTWKGLPGLRIAVLATHARAPVASPIQAAIAGVAARASAAGAEVRVIAEPPVEAEDAHDLFVLLMRAATLARGPAAVSEMLAADAARLDAGDRDYGAMTRRAAAFSQRDWLAAQQHRQRIRLAWSAWFEQHDLLICPAAMVTAFEHDTERPREQRQIMVDGQPRDYNDQLFWSGLAGLPLLPATVFPVAIDESGLPIGIQVIGPYLHDRGTIAAAGWLAAMQPEPGVPPAYA